jgi:uncharacterized protein YfiM (DUF2279 family)
MKLKILALFFSLNCYSQLLTEEDKQQHFIAGAVFSSPVFSETYLKTKNLKKAWLNGFVSAFIVGTIKETIDSTQPNNRFDKRDLTATVLGSLTSSGLLTITIKLNQIKWRKSRKNN